ncbi:MAG: L-lysine 6-transaminase [Acidobacteria bacterium]|nr:L-lysine 6-transaminase [Acidobacteriota bacterium]
MSKSVAALPMVSGGVTPKDVHDLLRRHMLVDGFHVVPDYRASSGSRLVDGLTGTVMVDFYTNFASTPIGYNHPKMLDEEFLERLQTAAIVKPANSDVYSTYMAEFVETFASQAVPDSHYSHLFFIEGGALAVENALKTAFDWKVRANLAKGAAGEVGTKVLHFRQAFHGRTGYTLSLTNTADPRKIQYFPKFDWPRVDNPKITFPLAEHLEEVQAAEARSLEQLEEAIRLHGDDIACMIIEPIQGEGGDNHFRPEFLAELRRLADAHGFLLIFDEVQTGLGLTGQWWAWQALGVEPDIFCFGKKVQACGIAASKRIDEVENNVFEVSSRINSTWGGNLVDMVRSTRYIEIICQDDLLANVRRQGAKLMELLTDLAATHPGTVLNVRGRGLMCAFDLPDRETRNRVLKVGREEGVLALPCGLATIRFRPFLDVTERDLVDGVAALGRALDRVLG